MTMTFEPFTPANGSEQREYGGRRRAEDRDEPPGWGEPAQQWTQTWHGTPGYAPPRQRESGEWSDPGGVETSWAEPRPQARGWSEQQSGWTEQQNGWTEQHGGWTEQQDWRDDLSSNYPDPDPAPEPRRGFRAKPVVLGVVVLLLLVAGWEAYRIESMSRRNTDLASVLTAQKSRTDRLEKELAGVFDPEAVSSGVLPSVFRVRAGEFTGTAFSVGKKGGGNGTNLLTNYHVIAQVWTDGGKSVSLERGATKVTAAIVKVDKGKDLALLRADQKIAGLTTAGGEVKPGQQVVVVGAPLGLDDTVTTGVISAYRPDDADGATIQFDAPINPGNSGGPVVNSGKQVVGLATAKAKDAEGIGLAIPIKTACETFSVC
jgi:putative serine protease PepD